MNSVVITSSPTDRPIKTNSVTGDPLLCIEDRFQDNSAAWLVIIFKVGLSGLDDEKIIIKSINYNYFFIMLIDIIIVIR